MERPMKMVLVVIKSALQRGGNSSRHQAGLSLMKDRHLIQTFMAVLSVRLIDFSLSDMFFHLQAVKQAVSVTSCEVTVVSGLSDRFLWTDWADRKQN